jgi:hypothetical protein
MMLMDASEAEDKTFSADDGVVDGGTAAPTSTSSMTETETPAMAMEPPIMIVADGRTPNSKPRKPEPDEETYVYRDFSTIAAPLQQSLNPQSLQAQKLPAKLASMLSDPGEISIPVVLPRRNGNSRALPDICSLMYYYFLSP